MMISGDLATLMKRYNKLCSCVSQIFEKDEDSEITGRHLTLRKSFTMTDKDAQLSDAQKEEMREICRGLIRYLVDLKGCIAARGEKTKNSKKLLQIAKRNI